MLKKKYRIVVKDFLGKDFLHNPEDGEKIVNDILENNIENKNVEIDFKGIKTVNTAFCNVIYEVLKNRKGKYTVTLIHCNSLIMETFERVRDNYDKRANTHDL